MKGNKLLICVICTFVAVATAVTAIIIFRKQIADFFVDIKERVDIKSKVDFKKFRRNGEYADYADV